VGWVEFSEEFCNEVCKKLENSSKVPNTSVGQENFFLLLLLAALVYNMRTGPVKLLLFIAALGPVLLFIAAFASLPLKLLRNEGRLGPLVGAGLGPEGVGEEVGLGAGVRLGP
jgi:hypothetical protein